MPMVADQHPGRSAVTDAARAGSPTVIARRQRFLMWDRSGNSTLPAAKRATGSVHVPASVSGL
jgi:hypothetical protein